MTPQHALWLPLFDELADPVLVAGLAAEAEEAGWHGFFVWDHLRWREPVIAVADPWITLAAIATSTSRLRFGPMVSPLSRRRPVKLARETATLDRLGGGRLTLGVGLGSDRFAGEFSRTGEECDDRVRARMLDEALAVLAAAWSGEEVHHHGEHYTVDGIRFRPTPAGRIPVWAAGFPGKLRPMRRAARLDGYFPVNLDSADHLAEAVAGVEALRTGDGPFDYVVEIGPGEDGSPYARAGATWLLTGFEPESLSLDHIRGVLRDGPR
ncbi:LLM class flavin-dependent oxidoreductase [Amycolatopsis sp. SID8362]|uniref:LLM class flavin-dependent oxidoreductase n=1 Tax=Amycolatopsis sp. SID8362 TaxID=2690346 RepID=UPI0013716B14|nr:LLM class flavin-dependent oxidoreductase [Amycolatopsis sp. SID8362]NBH10496.1 LLM class flavin-dependent oxidoreductase [Amycolatopsis sp. SID8362]NED47190.1 LLM class flavin-dependent oxidoreductase [Amycolatopsis sp. SID8362]